MCMDYKINAMSCKHMFAVMQHVRRELPQKFRDSPYFTMDVFCKLMTGKALSIAYMGKKQPRF